MLKSGKKTLYRWSNNSVFLSRRIIFLPINDISKQQAPEEKTHRPLFRIKHHCQDHLDPDCVSFIIARLKFNKIIFWELQEDTRQYRKIINHCLDLFSFCNTESQKTLLKLSGKVWLYPYWGLPTMMGSLDLGFLL